MLFHKGCIGGREYRLADFDDLRFFEVRGSFCPVIQRLDCAIIPQSSKPADNGIKQRTVGLCTKSMVIWTVRLDDLRI